MASTNRFDNSHAKLVQLVDESGNYVDAAGGGSGAGGDVNLTEVGGVAVATGAGTAAGAIRVELPTDGTGVVNVVSSGLPTGAATAALQGVQGTGAAYDPPTGGSGEIGYLSGLYAAAIDPAAVDVTVAGVSTAANQTALIGPVFGPNGTAATNTSLMGSLYTSSWTAPGGDGRQQALRSETSGQLQVSLYVGGTGLQIQTPQDASFNSNHLLVWAVPSLTSGSSGARNVGRTPAFANDTTGLGVAATGLALWSTSDLSRVRINTATTGSDVELVSATASQTTRVHRLRMSSPGTVAVSIKDGTTVLEVINLVAGIPYILDLADRPYYKTTANTALNIALSAAIQVDGVVEYRKSV